MSNNYPEMKDLWCRCAAILAVAGALAACGCGSKAGDPAAATRATSPAMGAAPHTNATPIPHSVGKGDH